MLGQVHAIVLESVDFLCSVRTKEKRWEHDAADTLGKSGKEALTLEKIAS